MTHRQSGAAEHSPPEISVVIKTLNEEHNIGRAIESTLAALADLSGEVVVADSLSADGTIAVASRYPVVVAQLRNGADRRCGAGPQLGFQYARGAFVYVLDGDMELDPEFLRQALAYLRANPDVAGVAGIVEELGGGNYEFEARKQNASWSRPGEQPWLEMGGLYRREAVERTGYLSNRNLHACEEQELGLRLTRLGGRLVRLPLRSVRHHGHCDGSWALMKRRLASRYSDGPGELVRASLGSPHAVAAMRSHLPLVAMAGLWLFSAIGLLALPLSALPLAVAAALFGTLLAAMLLRKRSLRALLLGMLNWQMRTAGFVRGLFQRQVDPRLPLEAHLLHLPQAVHSRPVRDEPQGALHANPS